MTQAPLNPVRWSDIRRDMTSAERYFACCLARGLPCELNNGIPQDADHRHTVRSEVVRFFAYGGDDDHPIRGSTISLQGTWVWGPLNLCDAHVRHALMFSHCCFPAPIYTAQASIVTLNISESVLDGQLMADGMKSEGTVCLRHGFVAERGVSMLGARIGGDLDFSSGKLMSSEKGAFIASDARIDGNVFMKNGFSAQGEVRLNGARIGGDVDCADGQFSNPQGSAFSVEGSVVGGNVALTKGFSADGEIRLISAQIGGDLSCTNGKFRNPGKMAILADGVKVGGSVFLRKGFSARGEVRLAGAKVGGQLDCTEGEFNGNHHSALFAETAEIDGPVLWRRVASKGIIHFLSAKAGALVDDMQSWNRQEIIIDGFVYDRFASPGNANANDRIGWLAKMAYFAPFPYEQAAGVLFKMGRDNDARAILLEKERELSKHGKWKWWQKPLRWLWDKFAGYGYEPARTFVSMLAIIAIGWGVFHCADDYGRMVPHQPVVLANSDYNAEMAVATGSEECKDGPKPTEVVTRLFPDYPEFNAFVYSADVFIPFFALHQEPYWFPARANDGGFSWITLWYWLEIGFGWILTSLFLLSITGVLRPRQSSGEKG